MADYYGVKAGYGFGYNSIQNLTSTLLNPPNSPNFFSVYWLQLRTATRAGVVDKSKALLRAVALRIL